MERYDGHGGGVRGWRGEMVYQTGVRKCEKVRQLRGSVTVITEMYEVLERCVSWCRCVIVVGRITCQEV